MILLLVAELYGTIPDELNDMAEKTEKVVQSATSSSSSTYTGKAHELIPEFSDYKEYHKRPLIYEKKMELANRGSETAFNVMSSLKGRAWDACDDLDMVTLEGKDGMKEIMRRLDSVFKFEAITELPSDFEAFFISMTQRRSETIQEYTANFERQLRKLAAHGVQLPDKVVGWYFLRRAGLSNQQRQMIMSTVQTATLSLETVRKAVNFVIGQDQTPEGGGHGGAGKWDQRFRKRDDRSSIYQVDYDDSEDYTVVYENDEDELYYQDVPENYAYVEEEPSPQEEEDTINLAEDHAVEYDDILANYVEARQKLNQMRVSRGYYPVVAMVPDGSSRPPTTGKGKKGKGFKGFSKGKKGSKQSPKPPHARSKGRAILGASKCLRCGQAGHNADSCPMAGANKRKADAPDINMVEDDDDTPDNDDTINMHEDDGVESEPDDTAMFDSGAASVVIGKTQLRRYLKAWMMGGFDIHSIPVWKCEKGLRFGNGSKDMTNYCVLVPTFFQKKRRDMLMYVIDGGNAPCLLGRPALENFNISIDYKSKKISWDGQRFEEAVLGPKGEFIVHMAEDLVSVLHSERAEAEQVFLPENFDDHVYDQVRMAELIGIEEETYMIKNEPSESVDESDGREFRGEPQLQHQAVSPSSTRTDVRGGTPMSRGMEMMMVR